MKKRREEKKGEDGRQVRGNRLLRTPFLNLVHGALYFVWSTNQSCTYVLQLRVRDYVSQTEEKRGKEEGGERTDGGRRQNGGVNLERTSFETTPTFYVIESLCAHRLTHLVKGEEGKKKKKR